MNHEPQNPQNSQNSFHFTKYAQILLDATIKMYEHKLREGLTVNAIRGDCTDHEYS